MVFGNIGTNKKYFCYFFLIYRKRKKPPQPWRRWFSQRFGGLGLLVCRFDFQAPGVQERLGVAARLFESFEDQVTCRLISH